MNKDWCFEPLKKYGGYVQTWEEYEEVKQIIEENLRKEKSTDKIEALTDEQIANSILDKAELTAKLEEKDKEIERLNNIINELEKWLIDEYSKYNGAIRIANVLDKLKELKEGVNNEY